MGALGGGSGMRASKGRSKCYTLNQGVKKVTWPSLRLGATGNFITLLPNFCFDRFAFWVFHVLSLNQEDAQFSMIAVKHNTCRERENSTTLLALNWFLCHDNNHVISLILSKPRGTMTVAHDLRNLLAICHQHKHLTAAVLGVGCPWSWTKIAYCKRWKRQGISFQWFVRINKAH